MPKYIVKDMHLVFGREGDKGAAKTYPPGSKIELTEEEANRIGSNIEIIQEKKKAEKEKE